MASTLIVVHVEVRVTPGAVEAFAQATRANAEASLGEPGVVRFEVLQDLDDPTRFILIEVYRDAGAVLAHKETAHYRTWREAVADLMAEPRSSRRLTNLFPPAAGW
jgi:(4S)-4-hydroxy-5-phosphonooxypentane-2,3-dione isomerase